MPPDLLRQIRETVEGAGGGGRRLVSLPVGDRVLWWRIRPVDPYSWRAYLPARDRTGAEGALARLPQLLELLGESPLPRDLDSLLERLKGDTGTAAVLAFSALEGVQEIEENRATARRVGALCEGVEAVAQTDGDTPCAAAWIPLRYVSRPELEAAPEAPSEASPIRLHWGTLSASVADWLAVQIRALSGEGT